LQNHERQYQQRKQTTDNQLWAERERELQLKKQAHKLKKQQYQELVTTLKQSLAEKRQRLESAYAQRTNQEQKHSKHVCNNERFCIATT
jgi:hypothetical protein